MANNLGLNIKNFRKNKGFTQEELAGMLGVTPQAVSRWESEAGLPDVSMIVPIAQALNITTDMLLGNNALNQDGYTVKAIQEKLDTMYDISDPRGSALKRVLFLADESNKNPMNFEIGIMYVQEVAGLSYYIDMEGLLSDDPARAESILEEGIKKGVTIIRYSNNQKIIEKTHYALAWIYIHKKDFENAREHINVLPSLENRRIKELITSELAFFEHGFEEMKDSFVATNRMFYSVIAAWFHCIVENYAYWGEKEEAIKNLEWCENIVKAFEEIPEYIGVEDKGFWKKFNHNKMMVYARAGEQEKANEICENYLDMIKEKKLYSEEEYQSIEKEFKDRIYQL
ncbi:MAG: helix-turn-helix domain-containing protein [Lachnospiraceae bacterium]|nr:helix-turn-helix domain-containing protein [Lachnospiraceae bacterium]